MLLRLAARARLASSLPFIFKEAGSVTALRGFQSQSSSTTEQGISAIETPADVVTAQADEVRKVRRGR